MAKITDRYDEGAPAFLIMIKWGSISAFAHALGKTPSTVTRWIENGYIFGKFHAEIIAAADRDGKALAPTEFVDMRLFENKQL